MSWPTVVLVAVGISIACILVDYVLLTVLPRRSARHAQREVDAKAPIETASASDGPPRRGEDDVPPLKRAA